MDEDGPSFKWVTRINKFVMHFKNRSSVDIGSLKSLCVGNNKPFGHGLYTNISGLIHLFIYSFDQSIHLVIRSVLLQISYTGSSSASDIIIHLFIC